MNDKEARRTERDARHNVRVHPARAAAHEDDVRRYLGGALYVEQKAHRQPATRTPDIEVVLRGAVPPEARTQAVRTVAGLARHTREPILHARVKITRSANPGQARPVLAQANLDVNGRAVRAQVAGTTAHESIDLLDDRLRRRLARLARHWEARRGGQSSTEPHEWRHGDEATHRPAYFLRPVRQRQVIRHKAFELSTATPDEAVLDLDLMDYEFQLFTDIDTGQDSIIYHAGPTGHRMAQLAPDPPRIRTTAVPLTFSEHPAPRLNLSGAIHRLNDAGLPFVFYADDASGRGQVLYRRYDGHYGLITPAG